MSRKSKKKSVEIAEDVDTVELTGQPVATAAETDEINEAQAEAPVAEIGTIDFEAQLAAKAAEYEDLRDRHLRLVAEFDNFRKRTNKQLTESHAAGQAHLVTRLLDALDDLGRVAHLDATQTAAADVLAGIELVEKKILKEMEAIGLEKIGTLGEPFDPNHHEAIGTVAVEGEAEANTVANVVQPGYRVGPALLRPAMVQVYM